MESKKLYRVNEKPNIVDVNINDFKHDYDPLGTLYNAVSNGELIQNLKVNTSFIIDTIISFTGYTESTLNLDSTSNFFTSPLDVEQCFFIALPYKSLYNYTLISFAFDIRLTTTAKYCATLVLFE